MEVQYKRLQSLAEGLSSNPRVGGGAAIQEEMENLSLQWGPLKDNIMDSLDMLRRCVCVVACVKIAYQFQ